MQRPVMHYTFVIWSSRTLCCNRCYNAKQREFTWETASIMRDIPVHVLLTEQEAAALLQSYMHHKSAMDWLAHDRQRDPVLPFIVLRESHYYREGDLTSFITRMLDSKARFVRIKDRLYGDPRNMSERRETGERRKRQAIHLRQGIERRRWTALDRRQSTGINRRSHATMI